MIICFTGKQLSIFVDIVNSHPRYLPPRPIGHDREGAEAAEDAGYGCEGADRPDRECRADGSDAHEGVDGTDAQHGVNRADAQHGVFGFYGQR